MCAKLNNAIGINYYDMYWYYVYVAIADSIICSNSMHSKAKSDPFYCYLNTLSTF